MKQEPSSCLHERPSMFTKYLFLILLFVPSISSSEVLSPKKLTNIDSALVELLNNTDDIPGAATTGNGMELESLPAAFDRLQAYKARVLRERLFGSGRQSENAATEKLKLIKLADFQQNTLQDSEIFLDTYAGGRHCLIFVISKDDFQLIKLPSVSELEPLLADFYQAVSKPQMDLAKFENLKTSVFNTLFGEIQKELTDCQRVVFSPDGFFNRLPVNLLLNNRTDLEVVRVPSASIMSNLRREGAMSADVKSPRTLAIGAVNTNETNDLPGAYEDLNHLAETYDGVTVISPNPGRLDLDLNKLMGFDIVHVAAHSVGDDRNVWQSAINLDPGNPEMSVRATDLLDYELHTRLVVLSRCSSATGPVHSGVGIQGLTSAFLSTGVSSVVAVLWPVDDDATGYFMAAFYDALSQGQNSAAALSHARGVCQAGPVFNLPFHYGGFVLAGDADTGVRVEARGGVSLGSLFSYAVMGIVLLGVIVFFRRPGRKDRR